MMKPRAWVWLLLAAVAGCTRPRPTDAGAPSPAETPSPASAPVTDDPLAGLEELPDTPEIPALAVSGRDDVTVGRPEPNRSCIALGTPFRVWAHPGPPAIFAAGPSFVIAGYARPAEDREEVFLVEARPGRPPVPLRSAPLEHPMAHHRTAAPGLGPAGGSGLLLAVVDGRSTLRVAQVPSGRAGSGLPLRTIAEGADPRFAPAVTTVGTHRVVVWTDGRSTPMQAHLARIDLGGDVVGIEDLAPPGLGACAPSFVEGAQEPRLLLMDAHAGTSALLEVRLGPEGQPSAARVSCPVGNAFEPVQLAAVQTDDRLLLAYTAVGSAAATAVGLLRIDGDTSLPVALVPSEGYGLLGVDGVRGGGHLAVFAASAPLARERSAPRTLRVRVVDDEGPGPVLQVGASQAHGWFPSLARLADGTLGLAFAAEDGVYVQYLRCGE